MGWNHQVFMTLFPTPKMYVAMLYPTKTKRSPGGWIRSDWMVPEWIHPQQTTPRYEHLEDALFGKENIFELFLDSKKYNSFEHLLR